MIRLPAGVKLFGIDPLALIQMILNLLVDKDVCSENEIVGLLTRAGYKLTPEAASPKPSIESGVTDDDDESDDDKDLLQ